MKFYEMLSKRYNGVFPLNKSALALVTENCPKGGRVLDVGCATGQYVDALRAEGFEAFGLEYEPMLVDSKKYVVVGDMHNLSFKDGFDTVFCTGNTLVHTYSEKGLSQILSEFARVLKPGGTAVIQILNYDRILKKRPPKLGDIKTDELLFERLYEYESGKIKFTGRLTLDGETDESHVYQFPITPVMFMKNAWRAGFEDIEVYGDTAKMEFDEENSFPFVAVMRKSED